MWWNRHRPNCPTPTEPKTRSYVGNEVLICATCCDWPVPRCRICEAIPPHTFEHPFIRYAWGWMCPVCVARVQAAGPWKQRRAAALAARLDAIVGTYPQLVVEHAPSGKRAVVSGPIGERQVRFTLKIAAREYSDERYVFRVELLVAREIGPMEITSLLLDDKLRSMLSRDSPKIVRDDHLWLRIAFLHLGKLDALAAIRGLIASAEAIDANRSAQ